MKCQVLPASGGHNTAPGHRNQEVPWASARPEPLVAVMAPFASSR